MLKQSPAACQCLTRRLALKVCITYGFRTYNYLLVRPLANHIGVDHYMMSISFLSLTRVLVQSLLEIPNEQVGVEQLYQPLRSTCLTVTCVVLLLTHAQCRYQGEVISYLAVVPCVWLDMGRVKFKATIHLEFK